MRITIARSGNTRGVILPWCVLVVIAFTSVAGIKAAEPSPKFFNDDPLTVEPETQDASGVVNRKIDLFYDLMLNQFGSPGLPIGPRAQNVNTIDEVPDS